MIEYKQIQNRRATAEEWLADNPILLDGEIGFDETNNNIKIGDGVRTWAELEYITSDVDLSDYYTKDETDYAIETTKQSLQYEIGDKVDNYVYEAKISDIETVLEGKADKADIPDMNNYVEKGEYEAKMGAVDNAIATKADAEETANRFSSVDNYLEQLHTDVEGKADKSDIPDMDDYVTDERFNDQMKTVKEAIDERVTNTEFGDTVKGLNGRIDGKVDTSVFTTEITNINNALGGKANKADIPSRIGQLENDKGYTTQSYVDNNYVNNQRFEERKEEFQQDLEQKVDKTGLKTINNESILGTGNIEIKGGGGNSWYGTQAEFDALKEEELDEDTTYNIIDNNTSRVYILNNKNVSEVWQYIEDHGVDSVIIVRKGIVYNYNGSGRYGEDTYYRYKCSVQNMVYTLMIIKDRFEESEENVPSFNTGFSDYTFDTLHVGKPLGSYVGENKNYLNLRYSHNNQGVYETNTIPIPLKESRLWFNEGKTEVSEFPSKRVYIYDDETNNTRYEILNDIILRYPIYDTYNLEYTLEDGNKITVENKANTSYDYDLLTYKADKDIMEYLYNKTWDFLFYDHGYNADTQEGYVRARCPITSNEFVIYGDINIDELNVHEYFYSDTFNIFSDMQSKIKKVNYYGDLSSGKISLVQNYYSEEHIDVTLNSKFYEYNVDNFYIDNMDTYTIYVVDEECKQLLIDRFGDSIDIRIMQ